MASTEARTGYAPVGELSMYYEVHGEGRPLVLLHGAYMTIDMTGPLLPGLAATRQVIAVEQQGHGHTADVDRPITYEQMADDPGAQARARVGRVQQRQHARGGARDVPVDHARAVRRVADRGGVPPHRAEPGRLPQAGRSGGVMGDLSGLPASQLAVLPGTSHFVPPGSGLLDRADWLLAMIPPFLDAPVP
jgi:hypothetical protein